MKVENRSTWTVRETAEQLGIATSTVYSYVESGILPSIRPGRRRLIPCAAVNVLLKKAPTHGDTLTTDRTTPASA